MNHTIAGPLQRAFSQLPRAGFDQIADTPIERMPEHDTITRPQAERTAIRPGRLISAGVAAAACLIFVFLWGWQNWSPYGLITLDVNPGFELTLNRQDKVLSIRGVNEEAQIILEGRNYRGWEPEEAVSTLFIGVIAEGYLDTNNNTILISGYIPDHPERMDILSDKVNTMLDASGMGVYIYTIDLAQSSDLQKEAKAFGVTQGKMKLIDELAELYPELSKEFLTDASLSELVIWIKNGYPAPPDESSENNNTSVPENSAQENAPENPADKSNIDAQWAEIQRIHARLDELYRDNKDAQNIEEILRLYEELEDAYNALGDEYSDYYTEKYRGEWEYYRDLGEAYRDWGEDIAARWRERFRR